MKMANSVALSRFVTGAFAIVAAVLFIGIAPALAKTPHQYLASGWKCPAHESSQETPLAFVFRFEKAGSKPIFCEVPAYHWNISECRLLNLQAYCEKKGGAGPAGLVGNVCQGIRAR
jgi:hypothetical protein